ncbi:MAG: energy transducer TonB [Blastocatellia bacterium]|nr:energy transducer TonB [Blastocatellia bacterium]
MFNNLVECTKTKKDKRTWMYFAVTSTIWTLALAGSIVGGIFLYDAKLDEQLSLLTMLVAPPPPPPPPPAGSPVVRNNNATVKPDYPTNRVPDRIEPITESTPKIATTPSLVNASNGGVDLGGLPNGVDGGSIGGLPNGVIGSVPTDKPAPPPPPAKEELKVAEPEAKPIPSIVRRSEGVIAGNALVRVAPDYPALARNGNITGEVKVEILISEDGKVVSTKVLGGHGLLQKAALDAARQWKFNPTLLNGTPVKVQGVITFRFSL